MSSAELCHKIRDHIDIVAGEVASTVSDHRRLLGPAFTPLPDGYFRGIDLPPGEFMDRGLAPFLARDLGLKERTSAELEALVADRDGDPEVRRVAASALIAQVTDRTILLGGNFDSGKLLDLAYDRDPQVRQEAMIVLTRVWSFDEKACIPALEDLVKENFNVQELSHIAKGLSKLPGLDAKVAHILESSSTVPDEDTREYSFQVLQCLEERRKRVSGR